MNEQDNNNTELENLEEFGQLDDDFIPADALPVCPKCLRPCRPLQYYCLNCDSNETINPLASYMPFVRIRFHTGIYGKMWRRIWYDKETPLIAKLFFLFMIISFAPILLMVGLPLVLIYKISKHNYGR